MSDDWQPGDLALCVNNGAIITPSAGYAGPRGQLRVGAVYTVTWVGVDGAVRKDHALGLVEAKSPAPKGGFSVHRFRKIRPHTPDAEDAETIRLLTGAPVREVA